MTIPISAYSSLQDKLLEQSNTWLVTGAAGFIGSHLVETLLRLNQKVVGLDNFSTGHQRNLDQVAQLVSADQWDRFYFIKGDICDVTTCQNATKNVDYVLHHAALGSVPRSIENPIESNRVNISGFLNMLVAARDAQVKRFVYAASSSTYGDLPGFPMVEDKIGKPLSPYAVTKYVNELYAEVFAKNYGFSSIGLRYFNIFGPRQDPNGAYAAVIPKWISAFLKNEPIYVNGDGDTSRDFCFVENVVQANLLAATTSNEEAANQIYNVAVGERTSLNALFADLRNGLASFKNNLPEQPIFRDFQSGDVRHSQADISKIQRLLGYQPAYKFIDGITKALPWYVSNI